MPTPLEQLREVKSLAELNREELSALAEIIHCRKVSKGTVVFFEGDPAEGFFILLRGAVRIYKSSPDGREYTLHHVKPGQMFAEAAIFRGTGYPANCTATEDSEVAFVPGEAFIRMVSASPNIALKIIGSLSAWLRDFTRQVEDLSLKEVPARLAGFLLAQAEAQKADSLTLDTSKTDLATRLGTVPETLSRNLKRLKEIGAIDVSGKRIVLLDRERLKGVAGGDKI
jgi:CRP/FNR family transcriptional regulator, dissimilatory nitrate respiration regulator